MAAEASVLAAQVASREAIFREMLEEDVLRNMEVIQAAGGTYQGVLNSYTELKNWAALEATLKVLALDTDEDTDPWLALGIATLEGPQPTAEGIDQRANLANLLASGCSTTAWKEDDRQKTADWIRRTEKMREECQADLPRISRERMREQPSLSRRSRGTTGPAETTRATARRSRTSWLSSLAGVRDVAGHEHLLQQQAPRSSTPRGAHGGCL